MSKQMKIVAGMGAIDDYIALVEAGADEVFCGFVPYSWNCKYGNLLPLNRREVLFYHVQIGSLSEMKILQRMVNYYGVPVTITMNALYYTDNQYKEILSLVESLMDLGYQKYIIADFGLVRYLREHDINCQMHMSGELGEVNRLTFDMLKSYQMKRVIFHRQNTLKDMESCIIREREKGSGVQEFEAFLMNERCQYSGGFCNSLHCDELTHLCKIPFQKIPISRECNHEENIHEKEEDYEEQNYEEQEYQPGISGCGLCALPILQQIGVTHLKVVGRGNACDCMVQDIKAVKMALAGLEQYKDFKTYQNYIQEEVLQGCSRNCYYQELLQEKN